MVGEAQGIGGACAVLGGGSVGAEGNVMGGGGGGGWQTQLRRGARGGRPGHGGGGQPGVGPPGDLRVPTFNPMGRVCGFHWPIFSSAPCFSGAEGLLRADGGVRGVLPLSPAGAMERLHFCRNDLWPTNKNGLE